MFGSWQEKLLHRKKQGNFRRLHPSEDLIDFSSNDYLGLARSPLLARSVMRELRSAPAGLNTLGSTGSRLLTGNTSYAQDLENKIARLHGQETGTLFSCGYMANVGLLSAVAGSEDIIFFDARAHASTRDGIRLSRARAFPFRHNDLEHLEKRLKACRLPGNRFICVESIYSTDGSLAPLQDICLLAKTYEARIIVDEAHAIGVYGPSGKGAVAALEISSHVFAQVLTFGKALGTYGAIVLGNTALKEALVNFATSFIYTTALPFHSLAAIHCTYDLFPKLEPERRQIQNLIQLFRQNSAHGSSTHIQSIQCKGNEAAKNAAVKLREDGFDARPLLSPTVRRGEEILRICLHAHNTTDQLARLLQLVECHRSCHV